MQSSLISKFPELQVAFNTEPSVSYLCNYLPLAFTGSRHWKDKSIVSEVVLSANRAAEKRKRTLLCIHGDCPTGLDYMVRNLCEAHGIFQIPIPAPWKVGKKAGPLRNTLLLQTARRMNATHLIAFPDAESRGTVDCMSQAELFNFTVINLGESPLP